MTEQDLAFKGAIETFIAKLTEEATAIEEQIGPMQAKLAELQKQRELLVEFMRRRGDLSEKPRGIGRMSYAGAGWQVLHPDQHMRLKDIYAEARRRGIQFTASKPSQEVRDYAFIISTL